MNLTLDEQDLLKELINIGVGKAAGILNDMTGFHIHLEVPSVKVMPYLELENEVGTDAEARLATVSIGFFGRLAGNAAIVFPPESATTLVAVLVGEDPDSAELDELRVGTLNEVGNIVINGVMGSIGNVLQEYINYSPPTYIEDSLLNLVPQDKLGRDAMVLIAQTRFIIQERNIEGNVVLMFDVGSFDNLLEALKKTIADVG
ncbi:chemotaxis protein CheX [Desulfococcaceae bacterium HSG7]|nr:chemotaxis protein CheX [Desulfococcaceae bacterium HSG9]MDM8554047.1 chemotaxis protein CheX [Desulfococcaceae bacterium HSG7]